MSGGGYLVRPGEGEAMWSLGGHFTPKARASDTDQHLAAAALHHREHEAWYVLDGQMTLHVGDAVLVATAGCFAFAPKGIPHAFTVDIEPTRVLVFATPAGFEEFALELGVPATGSTPPGSLEVPPPEVLGPIAERYGIEVVGPPLRASDGEVPAR